MHMRRCVSDGGCWAATVAGTAVAVDASGVLACFVTDVRVAGLIGVRVAASGVPDCFVATFRVAVRMGVRVAATGVPAVFVVGSSVALPSSAVDSIGLGWGDELAPVISVAVGSSIGGSGVDVIWLTDVGTSGP